MYVLFVKWGHFLQTQVLLTSEAAVKSEERFNTNVTPRYRWGQWFKLKSETENGRSAFHSLYLQSSQWDWNKGFLYEHISKCPTFHSWDSLRYCQNMTFMKRNNQQIKMTIWCRIYKQTEFALNSCMLSQCRVTTTFFRTSISES